MIASTVAQWQVQIAQFGVPGVRKRRPDDTVIYARWVCIGSGLQDRRFMQVDAYPFRPVIDQEVCGGIQGFPAMASRRASRGWMPWLRAVPR